MSATEFPRGSEWRVWDLHVHSPASFHWEGKQFRKMNMPEVIASVDAMIAALNQAGPDVFALMDYWTFDGWFTLRDRMKSEAAPKLLRKVFPGIELRLVSPTSYRLNAHVIFSDESSDQQLRDFRSSLKLALTDRPLSDDALIDAARNVGADLLQKKGFKKADVNVNDDIALLAGSVIAEITPESYKSALRAVPKGLAVGFMPWDTSNGLAGAEWEEHYAYVISLMRSSPIFETRDEDLWAAFANVETEGNKSWLSHFQNALQKVPRLAVAGSDAHSFKSYGHFPSAKATWIKSDPTFLGLLQAIKEPARRSYIGARPPKLREVADNKTYFVESLEIQKVIGSTLADNWFDRSSVPLNVDLVAIIGNKGSGKSALADVIALLGNSKNSKHFSFLSSRRFRQKPAMIARNFQAQMKWVDGTETTRLLSDDSPSEAPELIRYIPQEFFEELCNAHVSGSSTAFESELRAVVFSHTGDEGRQGALDFEQLVHERERGPRESLIEYRKELQLVNLEIQRLETDLAPERRSEVNQLLALKEKELQEHEKLRPAEMVPPAGEQDPEQIETATKLRLFAEKLVANEAAVQQARVKAVELSSWLKTVEALRERVALFHRQYRQLQEDIRPLVEKLGILETDVLEVRIEVTPLEQIEANAKAAMDLLQVELKDLEGGRSEIAKGKEVLQQVLNQPQQRYQQYLADVKAWTDKRASLIGSTHLAETVLGLKARLSQLDAMPAELADVIATRRRLAIEILEAIQKQKSIRASLFAPVQAVIDSNKLIREEYKLQFRAALAMPLSGVGERLFEMIKQNAGAFRGADGVNELRRLAEMYDPDNGTDAVDFVDTLMDGIYEASGTKDGGYGISKVMRVNRRPSEVYDYLYGFEYIEPRYTLHFQDTHIEHLSPGQRGALLLIFYLLVDKGHNPIILDQPEENLDNETVVSLLVPVLSEAKLRRQIIMVTHNPNLAVVCDAEQIIYSSFDRKKKCRITYTSGSIESQPINSHVVTVLEGTKVAFDNRGQKYL